MGESNAFLQEPLLPSHHNHHPNDTSQGSNDSNADNNNDNNSKDIVLYQPSCCRPRGRRRNKEFLRLNHNVFYTLILSLSYGVSESLWSEAVWSTYVKTLFDGQNAPLGIIQAVHGFATLVSALPIGYWADTCGRSQVIRYGSVLFLVTAICHAWLLHWTSTTADINDNHVHRVTAHVLLSVVMALWGVGAGIVDGPCEALFADSTPAGQRSTYYAYLEMVYLGATVLGPLVTICLFQSMGNQWDMGPLTTILYVGLALESVNAVLMMFFDDNKALNETDTNHISSSSSSSSSDSTCSPPQPADELIEIEEEPEPRPGDAFGCIDSGTTVFTVETSPWKFKGHVARETKTETNGTNKLSNSLATTEPETWQDEPEHDQEREQLALLPSNPERTKTAATTPDTTLDTTLPAAAVESNNNDSAATAFMKKNSWIVPYVMFASEMISAASLGLSESFFPVYLKDDCGMSPIQVQVMYALTPLFIAAMTWAVSRISKSWGRVWTILICYAVSIGFFAAIAIWDVYLRQHHLLLTILYILSSAFGDSIHPLEQSLMVDSVPKNQRARWMSLGSVSSLGWSGTAVLGGYLCDSWGYRGTFLITCAGEVVALVMFACLLPLVPRKESPTNTTTSTCTPRSSFGSRFSLTPRFDASSTSPTSHSDEETRTL